MLRYQNPFAFRTGLNKKEGKWAEKFGWHCCVNHWSYFSLRSRPAYWYTTRFQVCSWSFYSACDAAHNSGVFCCFGQCSYFSWLNVRYEYRERERETMIFWCMEWPQIIIHALKPGSLSKKRIHYANWSLSLSLSFSLYFC